jgi:hypothetical protein
MTCLEAQSNIMAFIDKKLPEDKVNDFVRHMKNCPNCSEELEIYYTLIVGTRQLDNNEELSKDFDKDLKNELTRVSNKVKKTKRFRVSAFSVFCMAAIFGFAMFYNFCLNKVYHIEQFIIKSAQGEAYFYDCFGEYIDLCDKDFVAEYNYIENTEIYSANEEKLNFYKKVREYNLMNIDNIDEENEDE